MTKVRVYIAGALAVFLLSVGVEIATADFKFRTHYAINGRTFSSETGSGKEDPITLVFSNAHGRGNVNAYTIVNEFWQGKGNMGPVDGYHGIHCPTADKWLSYWLPNGPKRFPTNVHLVTGWKHSACFDQWHMRLWNSIPHRNGYHPNADGNQWSVAGVHYDWFKGPRSACIKDPSLGCIKDVWEDVKDCIGDVPEIRCHKRTVDFETAQNVAWRQLSDNFCGSREWLKMPSARMGKENSGEYDFSDGVVSWISSQKKSEKRVCFGSGVLP